MPSEAPATRPDFLRRRRNERILSALLDGGVIAILLAVWETAARLGAIDLMFTSCPSKILFAFWDLSREGEIFHHAFITFRVFVLGFLISVVVGVIGAEVFGGGEGIGFLIQYSGQTFQVETVFVCVVLIAAFGIVLDRSFLAFHRRVDHWRGGYR
jgi:ABC-type nitrate/sulfonate/bicarbonate transport system permease component